MDDLDEVKHHPSSFVKPLLAPADVRGPFMRLQGTLFKVKEKKCIRSPSGENFPPKFAI
jgi:hypothetical protein